MAHGFAGHKYDERTTSDVHPSAPRLLLAHQQLLLAPAASTMASQHEQWQLQDLAGAYLRRRRHTTIQGERMASH
jgi:hypothetical protein